VKEENEISVSDMRRVLEERQVSFKDCAFTGTDLDALIQLLYKHRDRLAVSLTDLDVSDLLEFRIDTGDALPQRDRPFRHTPTEKKLIKEYATELLNAGKITYSDSPWQANILLVKKKEGPNLRPVIDFRHLNRVSRIVSYKLPTFPEIVDNLAFLGRSKYFTTLDLKSGFWQTKIDERDAPKTAFHVGRPWKIALARLSNGRFRYVWVFSACHGIGAPRIDPGNGSRIPRRHNERGVNAPGNVT
jgi:hypothetical protein